MAPTERTRAISTIFPLPTIRNSRACGRARQAVPAPQDQPQLDQWSDTGGDRDRHHRRLIGCGNIALQRNAAHGWMASLVQRGGRPAVRRSGCGATRRLASETNPFDALVKLIRPVDLN